MSFKHLSKQQQLHNDISTNNVKNVTFILTANLLRTETGNGNKKYLSPSKYVAYNKSMTDFEWMFPFLYYFRNFNSSRFHNLGDFRLYNFNIKTEGRQATGRCD